jgi:ABC-type sugar transport system substrate-binding protein
MGRVAVESAVKLLKGESVPDSQQTRIELVTKDTLAAAAH